MTDTKFDDFLDHLAEEYEINDPVWLRNLSERIRDELQKGAVPAAWVFSDVLNFDGTTTAYLFKESQAVGMVPLTRANLPPEEREELEALRAMYNGQCELTDEWAAKYREVIESKADATLLARIAELESSLNTVNNRLGASREELERLREDAKAPEAEYGLCRKLLLERTAEFTQLRANQRMLLVRAKSALLRWHDLYSKWLIKTEALPPAGDVTLLEDISEVLSGEKQPCAARQRLDDKLAEQQA